MAPRPDGLSEGDMRTLLEMATMVSRRLEADMAAAARARAKDELLRSLDFVRAPFALCMLAPDGRLRIRYANSGWAWETGAPRRRACFRARNPRWACCRPAAACASACAGHGRAWARRALRRAARRQPALVGL